jgi:hypothetical protein
MNYTIEYVASGAVVHVKTPFASTLDIVAGEARNGAATAKTLFGADGFQIRETSDAGKVVLAEAMS